MARVEGCRLLCWSCCAKRLRVCSMPLRRCSARVVDADHALNRHHRCGLGLHFGHRQGDLIRRRRR